MNFPRDLQMDMLDEGSCGGGAVIVGCGEPWESGVGSRCIRMVWWTGRCSLASRSILKPAIQKPESTRILFFVEQNRHGRQRKDD